MASRATSFVAAFRECEISMACGPLGPCKHEGTWLMVLTTCWQLRRGSSLGLLSRSEVFLQTFFMRHFGHPTAKPTKVLSNSPEILQLHHGPMPRSELTTSVKTTVKGVSKAGKPTYTGSTELKSTQILGP